MNDKPYSKREMDAHFTEIKDSLTQLKQLVGIANGRTGKLEKWRAFISGGVAIVSFIVIPLIVYIFNAEVRFVSDRLDRQSAVIQQLLTITPSK